ncbi:MAG: amidohydrolase [Pirellulaceae bacterium]|nr:amidohydrolase [Pirellulaceae bacterium]
MIIDAHAHIVSSFAGRIGTGTVRGLDYGEVQMADEPPIRVMPPYNRSTTFTPEMLLANMDWAGVEKAVLLQGSFYGERNDEVLAACQQYPERFKGAAFLDPWGDDPQGEFDRLFGTLQFPILKIEFSHATGLHGLHPGVQLDDSSLDWLWDELERQDLNLTFDPGVVGGPSYQTPALDKIARQHPDLRVVLCHLGFPCRDMDSDPELTQQWQQHIELGKLPNVWFDVSALPHRAEQDYPYPKVADWVRYALDLFGPEKLLWGTDAPGVTTAGIYPQLLTAYQELLSDLSASDQEKIFGGNATQVYRFG